MIDSTHWTSTWSVEKIFRSLVEISDDICLLNPIRNSDSMDPDSSLIASETILTLLFCGKGTARCMDDLMPIVKRVQAEMN